MIDFWKSKTYSDIKYLTCTSRVIETISLIKSISSDAPIVLSRIILSHIKPSDIYEICLILKDLVLKNNFDDDVVRSVWKRNIQSLEDSHLELFSLIMS